MSVFLTLNSVSARTPDRPLFSDLTFAVGTERVGLVGRNGSGKSTLLRIVAGSAEPSSGTVRRTGTIGVLWQDMPGGWTLAEALGVTDGLEMLERILAGNGTTGDFDAADWTLESRIGTALVQAGLPDLPLDRHLQTLSSRRRTSCSWTSRRTISTLMVALRSEPWCGIGAGASLSPAMIGSFWKTWTAFWS
jgi:ATPase subunit of ABC transporter with duplicated ATPase domains